MIRNSGKIKMLIIVIVAVVLLLAGLGIIVMKGKAKGKSKEHVKLPTAEMPLGEFIVNLADTGEIRYLKANVILEVEGEVPAAEGEGKEGGGDPRVRDAVIQIMSSKHFSELQASEGREKLKEDIIHAVNERLEEKKIKAVEVFFSEFAMQ